MLTKIHDSSEDVSRSNYDINEFNRVFDVSNFRIYLYIICQQFGVGVSSCVKTRLKRSTKESIVLTFFLFHNKKTEWINDSYKMVLSIY